MISDNVTSVIASNLQPNFLDTITEGKSHSAKIASRKCHQVKLTKTFDINGSKNLKITSSFGIKNLTPVGFTIFNT